MIALLAEAALRSLLLGAVVWAALQLLRARNPHLQKTVWLTLLLASIAMPFVVQWQLAPKLALPVDFELVVGGGSGIGAGTAPANFTLDNLPMAAITLVYAGVAVALLLRFALGFIIVWRIRRAARPMERGAEGFDTRLSPQMGSPCTFGSTILLPADAANWSEDKLAAVLSHERAHVREQDCQVQWLSRLHVAVFWFNPLAWWLDRRLAELAEATSDDAVIASSVDRTAYAQLLLEIARQPAPGRVVMSAASPNLSERIDHIISGAPPATPPRRLVQGLVVALLMPAIALAASSPDSSAASKQQTAAQNSPEAPPRLSNRIYLRGAADPDLFYPEAAKQNGIEGSVLLEATIDPAGGIVDVKVLEEVPAVDQGWGFGPAAVAVAQQSRFHNTTGKIGTMKFKVLFALDRTAAASPAPREAQATRASN
jgi:TonB family protein